MIETVNGRDLSVRVVPLLEQTHLLACYLDSHPEFWNQDTDWRVSSVLLVSYLDQPIISVIFSPSPDTSSQSQPWKLAIGVVEVNGLCRRCFHVWTCLESGVRPLSFNEIGPEELDMEIL